MKRLYQSMDKLRQSQTESSLSSIQNNHSTPIADNHSEISRAKFTASPAAEPSSDNQP